MERELTEAELLGVKAGMGVNPGPDSLSFSDTSEVGPSVDPDELSIEDLGNVYAGPNRIAMDGKALEHPELFRESQIDKLVEAQIKAEEMAAAQEEQTRGLGL